MCREAEFVGVLRASRATKPGSSINQGWLKTGVPCEEVVFGPSYGLNRRGRFRFCANVGSAVDRLGCMSSASNVTDTAIAKAFSAIPALLDQAPAVIARGRFFDCECLLGPIDHPFHTTIRAGRIVDLTPAPVLMRSWRFSYRASPSAWAEHWRAMPRPGFHDLLALTKRGEATLEGDLHPFMTHL